NGNIFVWKNTGAVNGGTIYAGSSGFWEMQYELSYVDIKWFGAHPTAPPATNTNAINNAYIFTKGNNLNLYISAGNYAINDTFLDLAINTGSGYRTDDMVIYGAGPEKSILSYVGSGTGLLLQGLYNRAILLSDFAIAGNGTGIGLQLYCLNLITAKNLWVGNHSIGIKLSNINISHFHSLIVNGNTKAIVGNIEAITGPTIPNPSSPPHTSEQTPPNLINF